MSEQHSRTFRVFGRAASFVATVCVLAASPFGCATPPPDAPSVTPADPGSSPRVLATFVGHVDTTTGTLTFDDPGTPGQIAQALSTITVNPSTTPTPNTVEMLTTATHFDTDLSGAGPCGGANRFCADVTVRSRFTNDLVDVYVQLDSLIPAGTSVYNGDPPSFNAVNTYGLWSYGQLPTYDGSSLTTTSRNWGFAVPSGGRFTFTGSVLADVSTTVNVPRAIAPLATSGVTSQRPTLHWALGSGSDGARVEVCRDRTCTRIVTAFDTTSPAHGTPTSALMPGLYFWRVRGLNSSTMAVGAAASPVWEFTVGARSAPVDTSWGTMLDVNGDGYADAVVGAPNADAVYVYMGSAAGLAAAPTALTGPDGANGSFGASVASAGDVNGDGYGDLVVGAFEVGSNTGRAYVYLGSSMGLSGVHLPALVGPSGANGYFGFSVASAGDVNGDGYADLVVGAYHANTQRGRAYVYYGGTLGVATSPSVTLIGPTNTTGNFGWSVTSAGDINGDGVGDLAVGAYGDFAASGSGHNAGRVYIYPGSTSGLSTSPPTPTLYGPDGFGGQFGYSVACAGDTNGDGYADLIAGAPNAGMNGTGRAYVYAGSTAGLNSAPALIEGPDGPGGQFAASVAGAGDTNGDGYADVIVGAVGGSGGSDLGHAYLYRGPVPASLATPATALASPDGVDDFFGASVAGVGDIDADGFADVIVGAYQAPWSDTTGAGPGRAYVYPGHASGLATTPATMFTGPDGDASAFGGSVATRSHDAPYERLCS